MVRYEEPLARSDFGLEVVRLPDTVEKGRNSGMNDLRKRCGLAMIGVCITTLPSLAAADKPPATPASAKVDMPE